MTTETDCMNEMLRAISAERQTSAELRRQLANKTAECAHLTAKLWGMVPAPTAAEIEATWLHIDTARKVYAA